MRDDTYRNHEQSTETKISTEAVKGIQHRTEKEMNNKTLFQNKAEENGKQNSKLVRKARFVVVVGAKVTLNEISISNHYKSVLKLHRG